MVLGRKTNFFLGKKEKPIGFSKKIVFLVFPRKKLVFSAQNHLFPRKKMVFLSKTNFFLGKPKNHLFRVWPHSFPKDVFFGFFGFPRKSWFFCPKPFFFLGKSWCSLSKTIFFLRKKLVFPSKTIFFLGKTKKTIFLVSDRIVSQKMFFLVFLVFPRKKLVFLPKTIFFLGKSWFFTPKPPFS